MLRLTPYEFGLYIRGNTKAEHRKTTRALSAGWLAAAVGRAKRIPRLKDVLPKEPVFTKVEKSRKVWSSIEGLSALGIGEVRASGKKKRKK